MKTKPKEENERARSSGLDDPPCSAIGATYDIEEALMDISMLTGMAIRNLKFALNQPHKERRFIGRIRSNSEEMSNAVAVLSDCCSKFLKQNGASCYTVTQSEPREESNNTETDE